MDLIGWVIASLAGRDLIDITRSENGHVWNFCFTGDVRLSVECTWRILAEGRIAHGGTDHGQWFGLSAPVDGVERSNRYLRGKPVQRVDVRSDSGDLAMTFDNHCVLEVLIDSCGYEGWQLFQGSNSAVVAVGGGELKFWDLSQKISKLKSSDEMGNGDSS